MIAMSVCRTRPFASTSGPALSRIARSTVLSVPDADQPATARSGSSALPGTCALAAASQPPTFSLRQSGSGGAWGLARTAPVINTTSAATRPGWIVAGRCVVIARSP
jgi:hypothetical protein